MFKQIKEDVASIRARDPAARSAFEIFFLYPGYKAVRMHRRAHRLYQKGRFFRARWLSERCRRKTGIDIHPAAKIGKSLLIDHGTGVVIGETCEIGDHCTLYQGVTLGGTGKDTGKRHPTLGDYVMVGAGASVLGPFKVGDHAKIAAGSVVLAEVPAHGTAVGVPARVVRVAGQPAGRPPSEQPVSPAARALRDDDEFDHIHTPDPVAQELCRLRLRIEALEGKDV